MKNYEFGSGRLLFVLIIIFFIFIMVVAINDSSKPIQKGGYYVPKEKEKTMEEELEEFRQNRYNAKRDAELIDVIEQVQREDAYRNR